MRIVFLFLSFIMSSSNSYSQVFDWVRQLGGVSLDMSTSVVADGMGNFIVAGYFQGTSYFPVAPQGDSIVSLGNNDIAVAKFNGAGNMEWVRKIGGQYNDAASSVTCDSLGYIYITGFFSNEADFDPGSDSAIMTSAGSLDIFVLKLSPAGGYCWVKNLGSSGYDRGYNICVDKYSNVVVTGGFEESVDFNPGPGSQILTAAGDADAFVLKLDSSGTFLFAVQVASNDFSSGNAITTDYTGNIYLSGHFSGTADFDPGTNVNSVITNGHYDTFILKMDSFGNFIWVRTHGGVDNEKAISVSTDADAFVYTAGYFTGTVDFDPGPGTFYLASSGDYDIFIQKLDAAGNLIWVKQVGGTEVDQAWSVIHGKDGFLYITGFFMQTVDFDPGPGTYYQYGSSNADYFLLKLNTSGDFLWSTMFSTPGVGGGTSVFTTVSGDIYSLGYFQDSGDVDPDSGNVVNLSALGDYDGFLLKLKQPGTELEQAGIQSDFLCFPNPVRDNLFVRLNMGKPELNYYLSDMCGKVVQRGLMASELNTIKMLALAPGMYYLFLSDQSVKGIKIIKH